MVGTPRQMGYYREVLEVDFIQIQTWRRTLRYLTILFALFLFPISAVCADVDGKWTASIQGMDGNEMELVYSFKAEGDKLTGSVTSPMGETPISEGKIEGSSIAFTVATDQFTIQNKGTISGDEIALTYDMGMGEPMSLTLKRTK